MIDLDIIPYILWAAVLACIYLAIVIAMGDE